MDRDLRGLSQEQQNSCRAALQTFIDRHRLSDWKMNVKIEETDPEKFRVKIEMAPPSESGLPSWPIEEVNVTDAAFDVAAEVDKMLELGYQARFSESKAESRQ